MPLVSSLKVVGWDQTFKLFNTNLLKSNENVDADGKITMPLLVWSQILQFKNQNSCHSDI